MVIKFVPSIENHTIEVPEEWYGKEISVEIKPAEPKLATLGDVLSPESKNYDFWKDMPYDPNFPSIEEIRKEAWRDPWKE